MLDHILQYMNSKSFHPKSNLWRVWCEEELDHTRNQHSVRIVELLTGRRCPALDSCQLSWLFHCNRNMDLQKYWRARQSGMLLFFCIIHAVESLWGFSERNRSLMRDCRSRNGNDPFIRKTIRLKKAESDNMLSIQDWKKQIVDHNVGVLTDLLLLYCTEICEPAFSGCPEQ